MTDDDNDLDPAEPAPVGNVVRVDFAARKAKPKQPVLLSPPSSSELAADRPEKLRMFSRLIERGMVMVTIDARKDNARVPSRFSGELNLNLNFSHKFGIHDFFYDDDGVRCSLSFQGTPFFVDVPWTAIYGMHSHADGERMVWPDSMPEELKALLPAQARGHVVKDDDEPPPPTTRPPTLRRIK